MGLLCHPLDQLPISCLITELTDFFTNAIKISSTIFALLVSWVYTASNSALASSPACFAALEAHSQAEWPSAEAQGSSSLASPPRRWAALDDTEAALGHAAPWEVLPQGVPLRRMSEGVNSSSSLQRQPLPNEFQPHILRRHSMCLPELGSPLYHSNNPVIGHEILSTVSHPSLSAEKFY